MTNSTKQQTTKQKSKSKRKRGLPEKLAKIDDTSRNVAHTLFCILDDKFTRQ